MPKRSDPNSDVAPGPTIQKDLNFTGSGSTTQNEFTVNNEVLPIVHGS